MPLGEIQLNGRVLIFAALGLAHVPHWNNQRKWRAVRLGCLAAHGEQKDEKRSGDVHWKEEEEALLQQGHAFPQRPKIRVCVFTALLLIYLGNIISYISTYSTIPRNGNPANGNHLEICLSSPQKNGN